MSTHAELAAKLLRDAADFFRNVGEQNEPVQDQMDENANVYEQVARLVESDPEAQFNGAPQQQADSEQGDAATTH